METLPSKDYTKEGWIKLQAKPLQEGGRCINGVHNNIRPVNSKTIRRSRQEQCCRGFDDQELEDLVKRQVSLLRATPLYPYSLQPERKTFSNHPNSAISSEPKPYFNLKGEIAERAALKQSRGTTRREKLKVRRRIDKLISSDDSQGLASPPFVSIEDPLLVKSASRMQQGTATPLPLSPHYDGSIDETLFDNRPNSHAMEINKIILDHISVRDPYADMNEKKKKQRLDLGGSLDVLVHAIGVLENQNNGQIDDSFHYGWFGHAGVFFKQKRVLRRARSGYKRRLHITPNSNTGSHALPGTAEDEEVNINENQQHDEPYGTAEDKEVNINENQQHDEPYCQPARTPSQPLIWSNRGRSRSLPVKYHDSVLVYQWKRGSRKNNSDPLVKVY